MKFQVIRKSAIFAAVVMTMTSASEPRSTGRTVPVSANPNQSARESIDDSVSAADAMLMFVTGAGILALQLRRRQKGLRTTRLTGPTI
jgi:hypothetical protein